MGKKIHLEKKYTKWGYIFIIPFVVAFLLFHFWPLASTVYYSFCYLKHAGNTHPEFLPSRGDPLFKNFTEIFASKTFKIALKNTLLFWICSAIPEWILAFWLAATITDRRLKIKGKLFYKMAYFFPKLVGAAWSTFLLGHLISFCGNTAVASMINSMINGWGMTEKDFEFFTSVQFFIIVASIFMQFGIIFIYAITGITGIPVESFEAAELDGATRLQTFFHITLPSMRPMLFFITVVTIIEGLGMNDVPLWFGAYDVTQKNTTLMMYLEKQAFFGSYAYDRAAAASVILLIIYGIIAGLVYYFLIRDKDEAQYQRLIKKERREEKQRLSQTTV